MLIKTTDVAFHDNLNLSKYQSNYLIKNPIGKVFEIPEVISCNITFTFENNRDRHLFIKFLLRSSFRP